MILLVLILSWSKLPRYYLAHSYLIKRVPTRVLKFETLYEQFAYKFSSHSNQVFGCTTAVHIHKQDRSKLDRSVDVCLLGILLNRKGTNATTLSQKSPLWAWILWESTLFHLKHSSRGKQWEGRILLRNAELSAIAWCFTKSFLVFQVHQLPRHSLLSETL